MKNQFGIDRYVELCSRIQPESFNTAICDVVRVLRNNGISINDSGSVLTLADSLYTLEQMGLKLVDDTKSEHPRTLLSKMSFF